MKRLTLFLVMMACSFARAELVREASITNSGVGLGASVLDLSGNFAYFVDSGTLFNAGGFTDNQNQIVKIQVPGFTATYGAFFNFSPNPSLSIKNAAVSFGGNDIFAVGQSSSALITVDPVSISPAMTKGLPPNIGYFSCGIADDSSHFGYFGTDTNPALVIKVDLNTLTFVSSITLPSPNANLRSAVIDTTNHYAYFGSSTTPGNIAKINLTNFSYVNTLTLTNDGAVLSALINPTSGNVWFGTSDSPGRVVRVTLGNFQITNTLTLSAGENRLSSVIYDPSSQRAYFGTDTSTGIIVEVNVSGMKREGSLTLASGEAYLQTAVADTQHYGYYGTMTNPGKIIKVDLIGGPPEITSIAPSDQEVAVGQTASFFVSATGRNLSYQWNRNGTAISGATQTSYQLVTSINDDGAAFACTVSNSSGSVTSGGTVLTVDPDIHVYPDPWRADRHSGTPLSFNGLLPNSTVEIFTLAAQWVKTIPQNNGVATWDLKNNAGQNVASGYYFYYVKTADDRHTLRGKFAVIR